MVEPKVGIAIATYNSAAVIGRCLASLASERFDIVLFDDASSDETVAEARRVCPQIKVLHGDGSNWWAGGTRRAVEACLERSCQYVVLLNPDVEMTAEDVIDLVEYAQRHPMTIVAPLVVDRDQPNKIAWAGSRFGRLGALPIFTSHYVNKRGTQASILGTAAYEVDEAHGRGVVVSQEIFENIGLFDTQIFPHYGADNDFSLRARAAGIRIHVVPHVRVKLEVGNTGMKHTDAHSFSVRLGSIRNYLFERKNGEALRVWWHLLNRHVPRHAVVPSYVFNVGLNIVRRLR